MKIVISAWSICCVYDQLLSCSMAFQCYAICNQILFQVLTEQYIDLVLDVCRRSKFYKLFSISSIIHHRLLRNVACWFPCNLRQDFVFWSIWLTLAMKMLFLRYITVLRVLINWQHRSALYYIPTSSAALYRHIAVDTKGSINMRLKTVGVETLRMHITELNDIVT